MSIYQIYRLKYSTNSNTRQLIPIINSKRRSGGFNGFGLKICLTSLGILIDYVQSIGNYINLQDFLKIFGNNLSVIRSHGGFCDNPIASQFEAAYKRLLIHNEIVTSSQANNISQNMTEILSTSASEKTNLEFNCLDLVFSTGTDEDETISMFLALQSSQHMSYLMDVTQS